MTMRPTAPRLCCSPNNGFSCRPAKRETTTPGECRRYLAGGFQSPALRRPRVPQTWHVSQSLKCTRGGAFGAGHPQQQTDDRNRGAWAAPPAPEDPRSLEAWAAARNFPEFPGSPGARFRRSWPVTVHGGLGMATRLWSDRSPDFPKRCWTTPGPPRTPTDQRQRNRARGDPGDSGRARNPFSGARNPFSGAP
eukprot:gene10039-biopygen21282